MSATCRTRPEIKYEEKYLEFSCGSPWAVDTYCNSNDQIGSARLNSIDECAQMCDNRKNCQKCESYSTAQPCDYFIWDEPWKRCLLASERSISTYCTPDDPYFDTNRPGRNIYKMEDCAYNSDSGMSCSNCVQKTIAILIPVI